MSDKAGARELVPRHDERKLLFLTGLDTEFFNGFCIQHTGFFQSVCFLISTQCIFCLGSHMTVNRTRILTICFQSFLHAFHSVGTHCHSRHLAVMHMLHVSRGSCLSASATRRGLRIFLMLFCRCKCESS